ncbi:hypothetical protein GCM10028795_10930 [Lysobacter olei]
MLFYVSFPYRAEFFGHVASASLAHLHLGLMLAVAMLVRDPWALRACVAAATISWLARVASHSGLTWLHWAWAPAFAVFTYALLRWVAARLGWPRAVPRGRLRVRDLWQFALLGGGVLALAPAAANLALYLGESALAGTPHLDWNAFVQVTLAKFFGVAILTLPIVVVATDGARRRGPAWWAGVPWTVLLAGLLPHVALIALQANGLDASAFLAAALEYRLLLLGLVALLALRSPVEVAMPALAATQWLFVLAVSSRSAQATLVDALYMARMAAELVLIQGTVLTLYMRVRDQVRRAARYHRASQVEPFSGLRNLTALRARATREGVGSLGFLVLDRSDRLTASLGPRADSRLLLRLSRHLRGLADSYYMGTSRLALVLPEGPAIAGDGHDARTGEAQSASAWQRVLSRISDFEYREGGRLVRVLPYLGVSHVDGGRDDIESRMTQAANAAFEARERGELRTVFAPAEGPRTGHRLPGGTNSQRSLAMAATVLSRIRAGELELHFQRIEPLNASLHAEEVAGEVLVRLRDTDGRLMFPGEFLGELQADHRMAELDLAVLRRLDGWLRENEGRLPDFHHLAVNISGQSLSSHAFAEEWLALVDGFPLPPGKLCFEVTETAGITHEEEAMALLHALRARGCSVALDDFGVGHQSFERLKQVPANVIKIDGTFVRGMAGSSRDYALVRALVLAAQAFEAETVAEFVEDRQTAHDLRRLGVGWGQGWYWSKPRPIDELLTAPVECVASSGDLEPD